MYLLKHDVTLDAAKNGGGRVLDLGIDIPPPTLARDLSALVADPEFADVRFVAEGRAIVAHRFILEARCPYFKAMFRSGMMETRGGGGLGGGGYSSSQQSYGDRARMVDVVVPDTFVGFLRLLIFIYTGTLPDGSDGAILEDLMAADRYDDDHGVDDGYDVDDDYNDDDDYEHESADDDDDDDDGGR
jgi:hypothetical protein